MDKHDNKSKEPFLKIHVVEAQILNILVNFTVYENQNSVKVSCLAKDLKLLQADCKLDNG